MSPLSRAALVAALAFAAVPASAYVRNAGHLPQKKASADATRLGDVIHRFQKTRLGTKCVSLKAKHGVQTLANLVNEEGRGFFPPRTGTEAALYQKIKDAIARGERLDPEKVLELGLEANLRGDEVNLQDTFLSIHNVIRLMARPETWWCDSHYSRGTLIWTPLGDVELTRGRWEPGWRGMAADSVFAIVKDITGHEPLGGSGRTLAEIRNSTWSQQSPDKQKEHQENLARARAAKQAGLDAHHAELDRRLEERARRLAEIEAARQALLNAGGGQGGVRASAARIGQMQDALAAYDRQTAELRATIRRLTLELVEDITTNATNSLYTRNLFDLESGVFSQLYGAEEEVGNGGNWYYFWLGAMTWSAEGTAAETFGRRYEAAQKWLGSEEEYARGLVQLSHFSGGAELARQAWKRFEACKPETNDEDARLLAELQKTTKASIAFHACANNRRTDKHFGTIEKDTWECRGVDPRFVASSVYPISWSGTTFSATWDSGSSPGGENLVQTNRITLTGTVGLKEKRIDVVTVTYQGRSRPLTRRPDGPGDSYDLDQTLSITNLPLASLQWGYFTYEAKGPACQTAVSGYTRSYRRWGYTVGPSGISARRAKELGLREGIEYPYEVTEAQTLGDVRWEVGEPAVRVSLTPTGP